MKIEVKGTPEEVLDQIGVFLSLDFPHKGVYRRDEARVSFRQHVNEGTLLGLVGLVLTVITFGLFLIVWALLMIDRYLGRSWVEARVERADDHQHTLITTSGTADWLPIHPGGLDTAGVAGIYLHRRGE